MEIVQGKWNIPSKTKINNEKWFKSEILLEESHFKIESKLIEFFEIIAFRRP